MTLPTRGRYADLLVGSNEEIGKEVNQVKLQAVTLNARVWRQIEGIPLGEAMKLIKRGYSPIGYVHSPATGALPETLSLLFDLGDGKYRRLNTAKWDMSARTETVEGIIKDKDLPQIFIT